MIQVNDVHGNFKFKVIPDNSNRIYRAEICFFDMREPFYAIIYLENGEPRAGVYKLETVNALVDNGDWVKVE